MLPSSLHGPGEVLQPNSQCEFALSAQRDFPNLDKDFITQVCYEHPDRFNDYFPKFDIEVNGINRTSISAQWISQNIRYDDGEVVDFWYDQFDSFLQATTDYFVFNHMLKSKTWPFPPVIIRQELGIALGSHYTLGSPYHLFEGTHRISYLLRMLELGMIPKESQHELLEISL